MDFGLFFLNLDTFEESDINDELQTEYQGGLREQTVSGQHGTSKHLASDREDMSSLKVLGYTR